MKEYNIRWTEKHCHNVKAESIEKAKEIFELERSEGFGGVDSHICSSEPYIYLDELEDE